MEGWNKRRRWGWMEWGGEENSGKCNSRIGVQELLFDMLKSNSKKLKCIGLL